MAEVKPAESRCPVCGSYDTDNWRGLQYSPDVGFLRLWICNACPAEYRDYWTFNRTEMIERSKPWPT